LQEGLTRGPIGIGCWAWRGIPGGQIIEYWGRSPQCSLISPLESPSMHNSLSSNFKLFQAGSTGLTRATHSGKFDAGTVNAQVKLGSFLFVLGGSQAPKGDESCPQWFVPGEVPGSSKQLQRNQKQQHLSKLTCTGRRQTPHKALQSLNSLVRP
jgi:hypothetical protein